MGLLYVFPVDISEEGFAEVTDESVTLKTYGLPYIFWIYALCCTAVVFFMFLAIKAPILKLASLGDETDVTLGYALLAFIALLPVALFAFFFYEKRLISQKGKIRMEHRVFGLKVFSETFEVKKSEDLQVGPFLSSPNMAKLSGEPDTLGFQNKGYFCLWVHTANEKRYMLDRHSRKADLDKLKAMLELRL